MTHDQIYDYLRDNKCMLCFGRGKVNDAEPGDIFFNTYECPSCYGTGFADGRHRTITIGDTQDAEAI